MTPEAWLAAAGADAERRGLPGMIPVLESLAEAIRVLRLADPDARAARGTNEAAPGAPQTPRG